LTPCQDLRSQIQIEAINERNVARMEPERELHRKRLRPFAPAPHSAGPGTEHPRAPRRTQAPGARDSTAETTTEKSARSTERHAPHCIPKTSVLTPLHLPLSTRLGEISFFPRRSIFWPIWRCWYPQTPSAAQPLRPHFLQGDTLWGTAGARHGWGTRHFLGFSAAASRPAQQSSRRIPGGDLSPRPARSGSQGEESPREAKASAADQAGET
jgi:hypothetical protein